jgi:hypothetical protein
MTAVKEFKYCSTSLLSTYVTSSLFSKFDLYTKSKTIPDITALKPYYQVGARETRPDPL